MLFDYLIQNGTLLYPEKSSKASIGIRGGKISVLPSNRKASAKEFIEASGYYLLPGLVDTHTHPVYMDDLEVTARSAAFGGVTTLIHYITVKPGQGLPEVLEAAIARGEKTSVLDFALHAALCDTASQAGDIPWAVKRGISSFKMFTAYKKLAMMTDDYGLSLAMDKIGSHGGMASVHAENGPVIDYLEERVKRQHKDLKKYFLATSPSLLDREAIFRVLCIGKIFSCPVYIPHVSSREGLEALAAARELGIPFYSETCPHYLVFTWEELKKLGPLGKIRPPLKNKEDRQALWQALNSGLIHTIASDHAPKNKKKNDDFSLSPYGAPGTETILPLLWELGVNKKRISANKLVELSSENPAKIFGLFPRKGRLQNGSDADLVLFNPKRQWVIRHENQHSNAPYTLYQGIQCTGRVEKVFAGGKLIVDGERYLGESGRGRFLKTRAGYNRI
jgi:dihydropyrimidinase